MIKEWWNENWKKILSYFLAFTAGIVLTTMVILSVCNRRINRADSRAAALGTELTEARAEVERNRTTINELRRIQSELTGDLRSDCRELHSIIESLQSIRDKVSDMEKCFDNYYSNCHYFSNALIFEE